LFALAEQGDVPKIFGHIHRRFQTPDVAIVATCLCTLALALTGGFAELAAISAIARLLVYSGTCASVLALRRQSRAPFTIPFGPVVPALALLVCAAILASATTEQVWRSAAALAVGAVLLHCGKEQAMRSKGKGQGHSKLCTVLGALLIALAVPADRQRAADGDLRAPCGACGWRSGSGRDDRRSCGSTSVAGRPGQGGQTRRDAGRRGNQRQSSRPSFIERRTRASRLP
jgi:hypothetical protein